MGACAVRRTAAPLPPAASVQPRPAATLGIGILVTTVILMLVTPALTAIYLRVNSRRRAPAPDDDATGAVEAAA